MYIREVKAGTKKAETLVSNYRYYVSRYGLRGLEQAYKTASVYKWRAWRDICRLCDEKGGCGLTVLGHNCMKYSAAFLVQETDGTKLYYFTADYSYKTDITI